MAVYTEWDNKIDDLVEFMGEIQHAVQSGATWAIGDAAGLVDKAAALQINIRAFIKRSAADLPDHELEFLLVGYSKLLDAKLDLVEILSDH